VQRFDLVPDDDLEHRCAALPAPEQLAAACYYRAAMSPELQVLALTSEPAQAASARR